MTWATSAPILVLGVSVLDLGPMYATDSQINRRQTGSSLHAPAKGRGHNNRIAISIPGASKISPLKNFADVSRTIKRYDINCYILVTHPAIRESGEFHHITSRIDKITLLLVTATLAVETLSKIVSTVQSSATP